MAVRHQSNERKVAQNAIAGGTAGAFGGGAAATTVLIICSASVSGPCIIIAGCLGCLAGIYFGKDAKSVKSAIGKGLLAGAITGAAVALSYVALNKLLESSLTEGQKAVKIKGKTRAVKISQGGGNKGVTVTIKHEPMDVTPNMKNAITKPRHSYVDVVDNLSGERMRYDLDYYDNGDIIILDHAKGTSGSKIIQRTIRGTGKGAKGTNKHLFKLVNKTISKVANKYNGCAYDEINKNCQHFASDAFNKATMGLCKGEHLANGKVLEAAKAGLYVKANAAPIAAAGAIGMVGPYVVEKVTEDNNNEQ